MGLDGLVVHQLVAELNDSLINARLHRIQQPDPTTIWLLLRQPGANYWLVLNADPAEPHLHLSKRQPPASPAAAPRFCLLLRKHLEPARLLAVEQPGLERIITLRFEARGADGQRVERWLSTELMGRHSNMLLIDPTGPTILDGIRQVSASQSRYRQVYPGRPYLPPPQQEKEDPFTITREQFLFNIRHTPAPKSLYQALIEQYHGLGPDAAKQILADASLPVGTTRAELDPARAEALWYSLQHLVDLVTKRQVQPWGICDENHTPRNFWLFPLTYKEYPGPARQFPAINDLFDWYFHERQQRIVFQQLRQKLTSLLQSNLEKAQRLLQVHERTLQKANRAEEYRLWGELLLAYLHEIPGGADAATLSNYYEPGEMLTIKLDPNFSVAANAEKYFRLYDRTRKSQQQASKRRQAVQADIEYLQGVLDALDRVISPADLSEIEDELRSQGLLSTESQTAAPKTATHHTFVARDGSKILVGKNNRQNDLITMKLARSDDLWLHVKDAAGAHVLIKRSSPQIAPDTLNLALQLAAWHSQARHSSLVPIDYCERRYVRKPKGAKPGHVIYENYKTAFVTPNPKLIKKWLGTKS